MNSCDLHHYLKNEGLSTWHLRRWIITVRLLRFAAFDPANGYLIAMEADFIKRWTNARS